MTLIKWDPFRNVAALQDRINKVFDDSFSRLTNVKDELAACSWEPAVDIYETDGGIVIQAEIPGVSKKDLVVEFRDGMLILKGNRAPAEKIEEDRYLRRERCCGTFNRAFTLQQTIHPDRIKAKFKDGILEIKIPRPEEDQPRQVRVEVEE